MGVSKEQGTCDSVSHIPRGKEGLYLVLAPVMGTMLTVLQQTLLC